MAAQAPRRSDPRSAVAEALELHRVELERIVQRRFPSLDARELYQRAALRALERCAEVRDATRALPWVRRILITSSLDALRERNNREIPTAELPEPVSASNSDEGCACTLALLKSLPPRMRTFSVVWTWRVSASMTLREPSTPRRGMWRCASIARGGRFETDFANTAASRRFISV